MVTYILILRLSDHKVAEFTPSRATNANSNPTPIESTIAADSNKRVNNFGHVPSVPSQVTMAIFLNRIILSCFTGAEWRVKWRIVEDVLVGWPRLREPTDCRCATVRKRREARGKKKKRQRSSSSAGDGTRRRGRQLTGEWSRASRSSFVRPAFPRLASPSMSFFRGTAPLLAAAVRYVPSLFSPLSQSGYICDVYFMSRFNASAYATESNIVRASGFISVKNIY